MPIETGFYANMGGNTADAISGGMKLRDLYDQRKEKNAIKDIYAQNTGPDGKINREGTLSALAKINPEKYQAQKKAWADEDMSDAQLRSVKFKNKYDEASTIARLAGRATDQSSWDVSLEEAQGLGIDTSQMPKMFDPVFAKNLEGRYLSAAEKFQREEAARDQRNKDTTFGFERQKLGLERDKLLADKAKAGRSGENLPLDQKKMVEGLSTKNSGKIAIKNQIDAVMGGWDKLNDDQKVAAGRQLLKVLNSTEGADAIGAEEAKRLGSKLEFAMGNFTNSNPTQFGRDLEGFKTQAMNTSRFIGDSVNANQREIDRMMGRPTSVAGGASGDWGSGGQAAQTLPPTPKHGMVRGGYVYMGGDPMNKKSWKLATKTASKVRTERE